MSERRELLVASVLTSAALSPVLQAALGAGANPDMWVRLMLCRQLRELCEEYEESIAGLAKRVSPRAWFRGGGPSEREVVRARRAIKDRVSVVWIVGRQLKAWYADRAELAGYDGV